MVVIADGCDGTILTQATSFLLSDCEEVRMMVGVMEAEVVHTNNYNNSDGRK